MAKLVKLTIDDQQVEMPEGTYIVDAAKKVGIDIPVFCYHPKLDPVGMCRLCLVEIGRPMRDRATGELVLEADGKPKISFGPKLETACTTPISEGMVVRAYSDKVGAARKDILEFLLTSHPLDCPICDKGGECPLQNLTLRFGPGQSRFIYDEKKHLGKHVPLGELIMLDRERCIQCGRCVRFQDEIVDDPVIGFYQRGRAFEIITFSDPGFDSYFSGNTTDICPVGALTTVDFRFEARPWEMQASASICNHCPVGCNTSLNVRREARAQGNVTIKRIMPRQNESVNEIWMCDKGRFAYQYTQTEERLARPLVRKDGKLEPAEWDEALDLIAAKFKEAGRDLLVVGGGRLANEDLFNLNALAAGAGGKAALYSHMAGGDTVAQVGVAPGTNIGTMGANTAILVVACDLQEEAPIWFLRVKQAAERGAALIVANPRSTKLDHYAKQTLRYAYGAEAAAVLSLVNALSAERPDAGENAPAPSDAAAIAQAFAGAENAIIIYGSEGTSYASSQALAQACANLLVATNHIGRPNNGLIPAWHVGNIQGAWDMGLRPVADWKEAFSKAKALYFTAANPAADDASLAESIRSGGFVVVQDLFLTPTAQLADVVLPALSFAERDGTYTNGERRVQRFYPGLRPRLNALPDFAITAQIAQRFGQEMEGGFAGHVFKRITAQVPAYSGLTYEKLGEVTGQWPIVGRGDMYYGGTIFDNHQGLGVQLPLQSGQPEQGSNNPAELPKAGQDDLLAFPINRLYDCAQVMLPCELLRTRIPQPYVAVNPQDAARLGLQDKDMVEVTLNGAASKVEARVSENAPAGVVLVPRSMDMTISGPSLLEIKKIAPAALP